jgi:hypothetical protein
MDQFFSRTSGSGDWEGRITGRRWFPEAYSGEVPYISRRRRDTAQALAMNEPAGARSEQEAFRHSDISIRSADGHGVIFWSAFSGISLLCGGGGFFSS